MNILQKIQSAVLAVAIWAAALLFVPQFWEDPFEYPKAIFFIVCTGILTIMSVARAIMVGHRPTWKTLSIEVKIFLGVVIAELLAFAFSVDRSMSLQGAPYRFQGLIAQLVIAAYLLNVVSIFRSFTETDRRRFFGWLLGSAMVASVVSLLPFYPEFPYFNLLSFSNRVFGTFGNPNYLAVFLIGLMPFLGLFFRSKSRTVQAIASLSAAVMTVVLFLTGCRSAWIGLIIGLVVVATLKAIKRRSFKLLITMGLIMICIGGVFFYQRIHETKVFHRLSLTEDNVGSVNTRIFLQEAGLKLFTERPIFGSGQETIAGRIEPYLPEYLKANDIFYIDRTHNEFLDILVMQGVVGFIPLMAFWIVLIIHAMLYYLRKKFKKTEEDREEIILYVLAGVLGILAYYGMNFATVSANMLLYLLAGYLVAEMYEVSPMLKK